jgi:hypothetical protein
MGILTYATSKEERKGMPMKVGSMVELLEATG